MASMAPRRAPRRSERTTTLSGLRGTAARRRPTREIRRPGDATPLGDAYEADEAWRATLEPGEVRAPRGRGGPAPRLR